MASPDDSDSGDPDLSAAPVTPDAMDALLGALVRAPPELPALAIGDELVGRFRIERMIGAGGMGAVYLATDRTLERQVAIKLHHTIGGTARLQREAVAMARLAHPNVITVFEVGMFGDQAFVAMEYIAGTTLRGWLDKAPRTSRERIAMLLGAGTGLAAAHDAGLVHRDFKPENVVVGDDGRPRVGDFGLARGSQSQVDAVTEPDVLVEDTLATPLTQTGAVLGTPAYMAPEQAIGGTVDARADQFAFCVVGWELLFGERPFQGSTLAEIRAAAGARRYQATRGVRVRASIRRVLERGLAVDPAARFHDMHALLASLRRASRSRVPLVVAGFGLIGAAAITLALAPHEQPSCDDADAEIARGLPRTLPDRIRAVGGPLATEGTVRVAAAIEKFATGYRTSARTACRANRIDHAWSDELYRRSVACLTLRLRTAAVLVAPDRVTGPEIPDLVQQAQELPVLDGCIDPATLAAAPALPTEPTLIEATVNARARLDAAAVEVSLGFVAPAHSILDAVRASAAVAEPAVAARIQLVQGGVSHAEDDVPASEQAYREAYFTARSIDDVEVTLAAVGGLIQSTGELREDAAAADDWIRLGLSDALRAKTRAPQAASAVYAIAARVRLLEDKNDEAIQLAHRAIELVEGTQTLALVDALRTAGGASCAVGRYDECFATEQRSLELARSLLGPNHPRIGSQLATMAMDRGDNNRFAEAAELARQAKVIADASRESSSVEVAHIETDLASIIFLTDATARFAEARELLVDSRARLVRVLGATHPDIAQVDGDLALFDNAAGHREDGVARLRSALAIQEHALGATASRVADTQYNLAASLNELARYDDAMIAATAAAEIYALRRNGTRRQALALTMVASIANRAKQPARAYEAATRALAMPISLEPVFGRGWAAMEAGRALLAQHQNLGHARELLGIAREVFVKNELHDRVAECDRLIAQLPR